MPFITPELQESINNFLLALFALLSVMIVTATPILSSFLSALLKAKYDEVRAKIKAIEDERVRVALDYAIEYAVKAAQQQFKSGEAQKKIDYALDLVFVELESRDIFLDKKIIKGAVESAVHNLNVEIETNKAVVASL
jgi:hypothetical protein